MKKVEFIFAGLSIFAFIMKSFILPWSSAILVFALMGSCLIYMTSSYLHQNSANFKDFFQQMITTQRNLRYFGTGFSTILLGCLFKMSLWEHADILILT